MHTGILAFKLGYPHLPTFLQGLSTGGGLWDPGLVGKRQAAPKMAATPPFSYARLVNEFSFRVWHLEESLPPHS